MFCLQCCTNTNISRLVVVGGGQYGGKHGALLVVPSALIHQNFAATVYLDSNLNQALVRF